VRCPNGELISMIAWDGNECFYYTTNHQNTVLALAAEGSEAESPDVVYDYSPYGERSAETLEGTEAAVLSPFGFTGAYQFQGGTVHLNHRCHSTFMPGFAQSDSSRQELNNDNYAQCDPNNNTDPTGLQTSGQCVAGYTLAAGVGTAVATAGPLIFGGTAVGGRLSGAELLA
jgi:RHS repeat-associated protein